MTRFDLRYLEDLVADTRFALRTLRRTPTLALAAVLILAIGIASTTTMFSVANALLFRPLPLPNGERLVHLAVVREGGRTNEGVRYAEFLAWRERQRSFDDVAAYAPWSMVVTPVSAIRANGAFVSANFFRALGVSVANGREFRSDEDAPGGAPVALVSRGFADRELGGAAQVVSQPLRVGAEVRTIVGVVDDLGPMAADVWLPIGGDRAYDRSSRNLTTVLGTLRDGVSLDAARTDVARVAAEWWRDHPEANASLSTLIRPLRERYVGSARPALLALLIATVLVLLVTCANVAGIELARAVSRGPEVAVRLAIGASHGRLLRQLLTETVLLSLAGGISGTLIAWWAGDLATRAVVGNAPRWISPAIDVRVVSFAMIVSTLSGILCGITPSLQLAKGNLSDVLRAGRGAVGAVRGRLQRLFVLVQIAVSVVLTIAAGLAIASVARVQRIPLGFDPQNVTIFSVWMQSARYDDPNERTRVVSELVEWLAATPGVRDVGAVSTIPLDNCCPRWNIEIEGQPVSAGEPLMLAGNAATSGYFRAARIGLVRGRLFESGDGPTSPRVLVVNETFARRFWPEGDALEHHVRTPLGYATIVGVVNDVKQYNIVDPPEAEFYWPATQTPPTTMSVVVRTAGLDLPSLTRVARAALRDIDRAVTMGAPRSMTSIVDDHTLAGRTFQWLLVTFGGIGLVLAAVGVFAVISFQVSQRSKELALRMALGSHPSGIMAIVLRQAAWITGTGVAIGLVGGVFAAQWLAHELYAVRVLELPVYAAAALALVLMTAIAAYAPARRASRVSPMMVLREE